MTQTGCEAKSNANLGKVKPVQIYVEGFEPSPKNTHILRVAKASCPPKSLSPEPQKTPNLFGPPATAQAQATTLPPLAPPHPSAFP